MNIALLHQAIEFIECYPRALNMYTTMNLAGLTADEELSLTCAEALRKLKSQDGSVADISTIITLLSCEHQPCSLRDDALFFNAKDALGVDLWKYERLAYVACWPGLFQYGYRNADRREWAAFIARARICHFIYTKGTDREEKHGKFKQQHRNGNNQAADRAFHRTAAPAIESASQVAEMV